MSILSLFEVKLQIFIILLCLGCLTFFFHLCTYYYLCTSGIWLHESDVLGASPDGFVQGDFHKTDIVHLQQNDQPATLPTIIEVKCPFTAKDKTIMEACSSVKDFFLVDNNGSLSLKTTHDYWHQIQGQLYLTGTECCDLVIWTTKDMQIVRIVKDKMWAPNISAMIDFCFMVFLESLK